MLDLLRTANSVPRHQKASLYGSDTVMLCETNTGANLALARYMRVFASRPPNGVGFFYRDE